VPPSPAVAHNVQTQDLAAADTQTEYTVLAADNVSTADATAAIIDAGGTIVSRNDDVGMFHVVATASDFAAKADAAPQLLGVARQVVVGNAPQKPTIVEGEHAEAAAVPQRKHSPAADPLDDLLWGQQMVKSPQAHEVTMGDRKVRVGILDTGIDATNPDIAPNFDASLSRNFAPDIPSIDGACEVPSCLDPVGTDDGGHGTHVAGIVGAAANGVGITGVAPKVTLVELKGGQDSGFFFLEPVVNALTYAANAGIDVVNMSFFTDPWLYNCYNNPADSPTAQAEQRTIIAAHFRALTFAHEHGVTLVNAAGNQHEDAGAPLPDRISPDFPPGTAYTRTIDNRSCLDLPSEGPHVMSISAIGPSQTKADYSSYGVEQITVAAPGGYFRDGFGTPTFRTNGNLILSTYPKKVLQAAGQVDADGNIVPGFEGLVFKDCTAAGACGYYTYLQGTSMASPHVAGVAGLIVSRFGHNDKAHPGTLTMNPSDVEAILTDTAARHACPDPPLQSYANVGRPAEFDALCVGTADFNGFYGFGIVDAFAAVTSHS
jgi:lantibiotic leader peptide-processing serine protease